MLLNLCTVFRQLLCVYKLLAYARPITWSAVSLVITQSCQLRKWNSLWKLQQFSETENCMRNKWDHHSRCWRQLSPKLRCILNPLAYIWSPTFRTSSSHIVGPSITHADSINAKATPKEPISTESLLQTYIFGKNGWITSSLEAVLDRHQLYVY